jgi:hypothetical protein
LFNPFLENQALGNRIPSPQACGKEHPQRLAIIVHEVFIRVWPDSNGIDFMGPFIGDPGFKQVLGKHPAFQEKFMVILESL